MCCNIEFEFIVAQTVHFRESLRSNIGDQIPEAITPEQLLHGHTLTSINIVPHLQAVDEADLDWTPADNPLGKIHDTFHKFRKVRAALLDA